MAKQATNCQRPPKKIRYNHKLNTYPFQLIFGEENNVVAIFADGHTEIQFLAQLIRQLGTPSKILCMGDYFSAEDCIAEIIDFDAMVVRWDYPDLPPELLPLPLRELAERMTTQATLEAIGYFRHEQ